MSKHKLKILPEYFKKVSDGSKRFELRENDRDFKVNDILILKEYNPKLGYTNREVKAKITYIFFGGKYGLHKDYCIMSIKKLKNTLTEFKRRDNE